MAQYFEYAVHPKETGEAIETITAAWCAVEPVVAVATRARNVLFVSDDGQPARETYSRSCCATAVAWRPQSTVVVTGWEDGTIVVGDLQVWAPAEDRSVHKALITTIKWSEDGTRFVTADKAGDVAVWRLDSRHRPIPVGSRYSQPGAVTHIAFAGAVVPEAEEGGDDIPAPKVTSFFFGGVSGVVYYADDMGNCTEAAKLAASIDVMEYYEDKERLVIITSTRLMTQIQMNADGRMNTAQRVKLSMKGEQGIQKTAWVGEGLLATSCPDEAYVRVWNLLKDENYLISLQSGDPSIPRSDRISDIGFNPLKSTLVASTASGHVVMWRRIGSSHTNSSADWEALQSYNVGDAVHEVAWALQPRGLLAVWLESSVLILNETELHRKVVGTVAAVQISSSEVAVERQGLGVLPLRTGMSVRGLDLTEANLVVWNGKAVEVYGISDHGLPALSSFPCASPSMGLFRNNLFAAVGDSLLVLNFQGTVTHTVPFSDADGAPTLVDVNGRFMAVATREGVIKTFDVSRATPKLLSTGRFEDPVTGTIHGSIRSIRCNCTGTYVSVLATQAMSSKTHVPDSRVFVYSVDTDAVTFHDTGATRVPVAHVWDIAEPKLLAVQTDTIHVADASKPAGPSPDGSDGKDDDAAKTDMDEYDKEALTFFATPEDGVVVQDVVPVEAPLDALLGLQVPHLFFITRGGETGSGVATRPLRDFIGLEDADEATKRALLDFSYHLSVGNMDEAYKAVKLIANPSVWENMAHMCVKSKRLDVAEVCLGNMGHSRGARAVREAKEAEPELEAQIAMVGVQLGLLGDAARLYQSCGRYDLLNKLYRASGDWAKAVAVAEKKDRIHVKTTHYLYARHLESVGDIRGAIEHYEKAKVHRVEVPRLLFDSGNFEDLEKYVERSDDKALLKWWAQFCESKQDFDKAVHYYNRAEDALALVRVYCFNQDFATATELVLESGDRSAAYYLARQQEAAGNVKDAMFFFEKAGRYNHAVRLAKEAGFDTELSTLALQASKPTMLDAARYFEAKGMPERAVQLYQKGGNLSRALDLCFSARLFDDLRSIADNLGEHTSPAILSRCAEFFMQHQQYDKAVHLLVEGQRYEEAVDLCAQHKVPISDDMAEKMTLPKPEDGDEEGKKRRIDLLLKVASLCKKQGSYHLATKKYTQAGAKLKAMRVLLKSGDTEKITFFANVSRSREIYVLAANYLQNLDWHNDPEIMKSIIAFYTKARAYEQLSGFYDACAAVEIDEYRNYEKALGALKEAAKHASKIRGPEKDSRLESLMQRIQTVERFVQARKAVKTEPAEMVSMCHQLLEQRDIEASIRVGDVFALLIEYHYSQRNMEQSFRLIENMRQRNIILAPFLDTEMVNTIYRSMGVEPEEEEGDDVVDEELEEDIEEDM